jgi:hypothetical protein
LSTARPLGSGPSPAGAHVGNAGRMTELGAAGKT